jgi:hypothetical protein
MKYVKMLGLLAVAAASLTAFAGTASATIVTSPPGTTYTGTIHAESEGSTSLDGSFVTVSCGRSTFSTRVNTHGAGVTAIGFSSSLTFSECNYPVTVQNGGSLELHGSGSGNATATSTSAQIEIQTSVGTCIFTTTFTDIGTLTGSASTKSNATLDIGSAAIPRTGGNFLCGLSATWTGAYRIWSPSNLNVH